MLTITLLDTCGTCHLVLTQVSVGWYLLSFAVVGVVIWQAQRMRDIARHLGRSPSGWAAYGLLVPGISYLHLRRIQQTSTPGCGLLCRLRLTDGRSTAILTLRDVSWEITFKGADSDLRSFVATPEDRRAPSGLKGVERGEPSEGILWFSQGEDVRRYASRGASFDVRDVPRRFGNEQRNVLAEGEVIDVLPAESWQGTKGLLDRKG